MRRPSQPQTQTPKDKVFVQGLQSALQNVFNKSKNKSKK